MLVGAGALLPLAGTTWAAEEAAAKLWARAAFVSLPLIPPAAYGFTLAVLHLRERRRRAWRVLWALGAVFSSSTLAGHDLVAGVTAFQWGFFPRFGELGAPFLIFALGVLGLCMRHYWLQYRRALRPDQKRRVVAFMAAFGVGHVALFDVFAAYGSEVYPFGYVGTFAFALPSACDPPRRFLAQRPNGRMRAAEPPTATLFFPSFPGIRRFGSNRPKTPNPCSSRTTPKPPGSATRTPCACSK
jgi:hypothetical protein